MQILSRQEVNTGKIFADIVLTKEEGERLIDGKVVNGDLPELSIQIVGYGDEPEEELTPS